MRITYWGLLILVAVLGLGVGSAFAAGLALGQSQGQPPSAPSLAERAGGETAAEAPGQGRGGGETASPRRAPEGRPPTTGTVERLEGTILIVSTPNGPARVALDGAQIQKLTAGSVEDLKAGARVLISGERRDDGTVAARSIQILPQGP